VFLDAGPRQQINELTSFVDLSQVYGNDENVSMELRELTPIGESSHIEARDTRPVVTADKAADTGMVWYTRV